MTTIITNRPGLTWNAIAVTATTTVSRSVKMIGSYEYAGLLVNGAFIALARTAHIAARAELDAEIAAVEAELLAAVAALAPAAPVGRTLISEDLPLAHRANTDAPGHWEARVAALKELTARHIAQGVAEALAAEWAMDALDGELETALAADEAERNCYGDPMPSADEALARQLVGELNEMGADPPSYDRARYEAKSAQVRRLGYDIGPSDPSAPIGSSALCVYDKAAQRPLGAAGRPQRRAAA